MRGFWPVEHDDELKRLMNGDSSFSQIANEISGKFGVYYTRNACIGRAGRLGLSKPRLIRPAKPPRPAAPKRMPKPKPAPRHFERDTTTNLRVADVVPLHVLLIDLEPRHCRWPYGDGPFTFCGCEAFAGGPYCEPHEALSLGQGTIGERSAHRVLRSLTA